MRGDEAITADDPDLFDAADDGDVLVSVFGRHGVAVAIEADQRERIGPAAGHPARIEALLGQGQERRPLFFEQRRLGHGLGRAIGAADRRDSVAPDPR